MALTTIAEYKVYANLSGTSEDTRLTALLGVATSIVRKIGGRSQSDGFESATRTEVCDGNGSRSVLVDETPVTSVTSVSWLSSDGSTSTLPAAAYTVNQDEGIIYAVVAGSGPIFNSAPVSSVGYGPTGGFPYGKRNVQVVYVGGYATIPDGLKLAVWMVMDWLRTDAGRNPSMQSESIGGEYSYSRLAADPKGPFAQVSQIVWAF